MADVIVSVAQRALVAGTPLLIGTIGEIICERSGILNLGVEGVMAIGAVTAFVVTHYTGDPWIGLCAAIAAGMAISIVHAFASVSLQSNQVVSGLSLAMLGLGLAGLLGKPFVGKPLAVKIQDMPIPYLVDIPVLGSVLFSHSPFFLHGSAAGHRRVVRARTHAFGYPHPFRRRKSESNGSTGNQRLTDSLHGSHRRRWVFPPWPAPTSPFRTANHGSREWSPVVAGSLSP